MKKFASLLLAVLMVCTMIPLSALPAFAAEEKCDIITFESVNSKKSDNGLFTLKTNKVSSQGWCCGENKYWIKIFGEPELTITRIEAELTNYEAFYQDVAISHGNIQERKWRENIFIVTDIDSHGFHFLTDSKRIYTFKDIKVYYTDEASNTASIISNGYPEILYGIGGLAVGMAVMFFIMKKKSKPTLAESAVNEDEE